MAIPKIIYQTYRNSNLPWITRFFIWWGRSQNKDYRYEFYNDERIEAFLKKEYAPDVYNAYSKLAIGAAKGDFFRYAILYKTGGVYMDIDGAILRPLHNIILPEDSAIITRENVKEFRYVQWALVYDKGHPFMKKTLDQCIDNIKHNRYPHDVHRMTGPTAYTEAIQESLKENPTIEHRVFGFDYERKKKGVLIPKHFLNRVMYFRNERWNKVQLKRTVLK